MHTPSRHLRRSALTVLALGAATALVFFGSLAAWTASTTNPGNSVTMGELTIDSDKDAVAIFTAEDVFPGDEGGDTVTLTNDSESDLDLHLTQSAVSQTASNNLRLRIDDGTTCIYPAGASPCAAWGNFDGSATLADLDIGTLAEGASRTFNVQYRLDEASPDSDQTTVNTFTLTWDGTVG